MLKALAFVGDVAGIIMGVLFFADGHRIVGAAFVALFVAGLAFNLRRWRASAIRAE